MPDIPVFGARLAGAARLLLLSYLASACSVSNFQSTTTVPVAGSAPIPHAYVHLVGGITILPMSDVIVVADSVVGFDEPSGARRAIPESSVALVETRSVSPARTIGLMGGIVAGVAVVGALVLGYIIAHSRID